MNCLRNQRGSSLVAVLLALFLIALMVVSAMRNKKMEEGIQNSSFIKESGVDSSSYKSILDSTKKIIDDAETTQTQLP